jgi:hypothetical protein
MDNAMEDLKELLDNPIDKPKLEKLLNQLEAELKENEKDYEEGVVELREGEREYSEREEPLGYRTERLSITDRAQLIEEVRKLRKMIDVYHM